MSSIVISGDTSGAITIEAPAVAGTTTISLPAITGSFVTANSSGNVGIGTGSPGSLLDVLGGISSTSNWGNVNITSRNAINANDRIYTGLRFQDSGASDAGAIGYAYDGTGYNMQFATVPTVGGALTSRMIIDRSGNVGIGTSSPDTRLHVIGDFDNSASKAGNNANKGLTITSSAAGATNYANGNEFGVIFAANNAGATDYPVAGVIAIPDNAGSYVGGSLVFQTHTSSESTLLEKMRINSSGNVGIGTSSPSSTLQLKASSGNTGLYIQDASGSPNLSFLDSAGTVQWQLYSTMGGAAGLDPLILYNSSVGSVATFSTSGNLGLGVTPSAWASGWIALQTGSRAAVFTNPSKETAITNNMYVNSGGTNTYIETATAAAYLQTSGAHIWFNAPSGTAGNAISFTQAMTLDASGNLLVGTTNSAPSSGIGFKVQTPVSGHWDPCVVTSYNDGSRSCWDMYSTGAAAYHFYVTTNGTVNAVTTTISAISDQRLKENIRDLDAGLDKIMELKPRLFDWKEGKGANIKNARGFIAQEFELVFPDLIGEWKDPAPEGEEPYKSVRQDLIPVLVKAIQELKAELDSVKAELAALKGN